MTTKQKELLAKRLGLLSTHVIDAALHNAHNFINGRVIDSERLSDSLIRVFKLNKGDKK